MKQYFIEQRHLPSLTLFLPDGEWTNGLFALSPADRDLLVCYDYRSLDFDFSLPEGYEDIRVVGWSMGVWAASQVLGRSCLPITESVAVNGTMTPVDDSRGIPNAIYEGTLKGLNDVTLRKFFRRMCGSAVLLEDFLTRSPGRSTDEVKEELLLIAKQAECLAPARFAGVRP